MLIGDVSFFVTGGGGEHQLFDIQCGGGAVYRHACKWESRWIHQALEERTYQEEDHSDRWDSCGIWMWLLFFQRERITSWPPRTDLWTRCPSPRTEAPWLPLPDLSLGSEDGYEREYSINMMPHKSYLTWQDNVKAQPAVVVIKIPISK